MARQTKCDSGGRQERYGVFAVSLVLRMPRRHESAPRTARGDDAILPAGGTYPRARNMKLLVFSDIHGDRAALQRLLDTEADYYFAAGDLVSWGRGLDRMGDILRQRADRMYVLPGNHESPEQITQLCARFGLHDFHGRHFQAGG